MNLAEIQKAASDAYRTAHDSHSPSSNPNQSMHERGIAAVVAAMAQAMLAELRDDDAEVWEMWDDDGLTTMKGKLWTDKHGVNRIFANRLASLLKPADERVAVVRAVLCEFSEDWTHVDEYTAKIVAALDALPKIQADTSQEAVIEIAAWLTRGAEAEEAQCHLVKDKKECRAKAEVLRMYAQMLNKVEITPYQHDMQPIDTRSLAERVGAMLP